MRIIIQHDGSSAHYFDRTGLARVLSYSGHEIIWWDSPNKPAFDLFAEVGQVDLLISQTYNIDRALTKIIQQRPEMRLICKAGEWGVHTDGWGREQKEKYPILIESKKVREHILELKEQTGKPDFVFCHYHPDYLEQTHGHWDEQGIPSVSIMNGADLWDYTDGQYNEAFASDCVFVGGAWAYKYRTLEKYIVPLCNPNLNLKIKIFGNGWNLPQYMGMAPQEQVKHILKSSAVCLNCHELHSQDFGYDIIERPFKLASNKCFMVSDYVEGLEKLYGDAIVYGHKPEDYIEKVLYFLRNPDQKMKFVKKAYDITIRWHTYFERAIAIMDFYGLTFEVNKIRQAKERLIKEFSL